MGRVTPSPLQQFKPPPNGPLQLLFPQEPAAVLASAHHQKHAHLGPYAFRKGQGPIESLPGAVFYVCANEYPFHGEPIFPPLSKACARQYNRLKYNTYFPREAPGGTLYGASFVSK